MTQGSETSSSGDQRGYFAHAKALVESSSIGDGSRIWAFAHVLPGAVIGSDCNICDHVFIENDVRVGNRVTVKCGVQLWDGIELEDDVFVGPNVTFTNDPFPRSRAWPEKFARTRVCRGASLGANATILPGLTIGPGAMVGAGSVVTRDVPPFAVVLGVPARVVRYLNASERPSESRPAEVEGSVSAPKVRGVSLHRLHHARDLRGSLAAMELQRLAPFEVQRLFIVYDVPSREVRGEHAHRRLEQFLICVRGSCQLLLDDGLERDSIRLSDPTLGVFVPPMVWGVQLDFSPDAVLLVLASAPYDPDDYIRDYEQFRAEVARSS